MLQIHFFRIGVPHSFPGVVQTGRFPVSGMIVTTNATADVDAFVNTRAREMAQHLLPRMQAAQTQRYIQPLAALAIGGRKDRKLAQREHLLALPDPNRQHANPAVTCEACTAALMIELQDDMERYAQHLEYIQAQQVATSEGLEQNPQDLASYELGLNYQLHGLPI